MLSGFGLSLTVLLAAVGLPPAQGPLASPCPDGSFIPDLIASHPDGSLGRSPPGDRASDKRYWVGAEYLQWWIKDGPLPFPVVTTGDPNDLVPGALGQQGTRPLFGGHGLDYGSFSGLRLDAGAWLDAGRSVGLEGIGFLLERRSTGFGAASDATGTPPLYIPLFRGDLDREGSFTLSDPVAGFDGHVAVSSATRLWGGEVNGLVNVLSRNGLRVDLLAGLRYVDLEESLQIDAVSNDDVFVVTDVTHDSFHTRNQFYGGQIGTRVGWGRDRLAVDLIGKLALGANHEVVEINGSTTESGVGAAFPGTFSSGIFTQPSNIGRRSHDQFAVIPEAQIKVGYRLTKELRAFVGYDVLYWNQVVRPGSQIDRAINPTQTLGGELAGPARPAPLFSNTDFWAQGVTFGLEFRY